MKITRIIDDNLEKLRKQNEAFLELLRKADPIIQLTAMALSKIDDNIIDIRPAVDTKSLDIDITGDRFTIQAAWGQLRKVGWKPDIQMPSEPFSSHSGWWRHDELPGELKLWVRFASTTCKRVKIGTRTETVEKDVYEIVCSDEIPQH